MKNSYILFSISLLLIGFGLLMAPNEAKAWSSYSSSYMHYGYGMMGSNYGYNNNRYAFSGAGYPLGFNSSSTFRPTYYPYSSYTGGYYDNSNIGSSYSPYVYSNMMGNNYGHSGYNNYTFNNNYDNYGYNGYNGYNNNGYRNGESCYGYGC